MDGIWILFTFAVIAGAGAYTGCRTMNAAAVVLYWLTDKAGDGIVWLRERMQKHAGKAKEEETR